MDVVPRCDFALFCIINHCCSKLTPHLFWQVTHHQAARCYYMAHSYFVATKYEEAYALFQRCSERAEKAIGLHEEMEDVDHSLIEEMELMKLKSTAFW